jgi:malate dehydrogenase
MNKFPRVTIIGGGKVGSTLAQRIIEKNLAEVVLLDVVAGMPQGIALDMNQAGGLAGYECQIYGTNDYADTANSEIVIITAGLPRKPGMSRNDLLKINGEIVTQAAEQAIAQSPNAILIVVTNPLDVMTYLAWQATKLPSQRVMGMAGILDSARFQYFIAQELRVSIRDVSALVLGGHGDLMVPLPRYSTVGGVPITELLEPGVIDRLVARTQDGGAEIVNLMRTGGAYLAPASAIYTMMASILDNQKRQVPAAVYLQGQYGLEDIFVGVPCRLGQEGVEKILELDLTPEELAQLQRSAASVRENIQIAKAELTH